MESKSCPNCSSEMKYVKGGVSKAGKPYTAFWSCPNPVCKATVNIDPPQTMPSPQPIYNTPKRTSTDWTEEFSPKMNPTEFLEQNLNRRAALDKATQVTIARISTGQDSSSANIINLATIFLNFIEGKVDSEPSDQS